MQLDIFGAAPAGEDILLKGGHLVYYSNWLAPDLCDKTFKTLMNTCEWTQPDIIVAGQKYAIPRLQAWHGDETSIMEYSQTRFYPQPWTPELAQLRQRVEDATGAKFNSVLVNLYRSGADGVGWHADDEPELGEQPTIASLSLGQTRNFVLKPKAGGKATSIPLKNGDLLVMKSHTQTHWLHSIPKTLPSVGARINLTFRYINS